MVRSRLAAFLAIDAARPIIWGEHDCATRMADWYACATGKPDPVARYRRTYNSRAECDRKYGPASILRLTRAVVRELGLERTHAPQAGDIGVIELLGRAIREMYGAIKLNVGWSVQSEKGLAKLPDDCMRIIAAWRIPQDAAGSSSSSCR